MKKAFAVLVKGRLTRAQIEDRWIVLCRRFYIENPSAPKPRIVDVATAPEASTLDPDTIADFWAILQASHFVVRKFQEKQVLFRDAS